MFENLNANAFEKLWKEHPEAEVIDVRTDAEYNEAHLPSATQIDVMQGDFQQKVDQLDKDKKYLVYCRSGARSFNACNLMTNLGFKDVTNLEGGIMGWHGEVER